MSSPLLPSFRRQQRLVDFTSLQHSCPAGIYISLSPDNPALWSGVVFVRSGPYDSAVLRFDFSFPADYPSVAPLITFSTDIFHPLVVPLTSYTFSTSALNSAGTVSASDEDRLPPGAFSLRHGFPLWFPNNSSTSGRVSHEKNDPDDQKMEKATSLLSDTYDTRAVTLQVLEHVKASFGSEELLDQLPLSAAGNPSAWHAWRAHRGLTKRHARGRSPTQSDPDKPPSSPRQPGEWNWDGVWESRVQEGVNMSKSEGALFGSSATQGPIRFSKIDPEELARVRKELRANP